MLVKYGKPNVLGLGMKDGSVFILKPGVNDVPDGLWNEVKDNETIKTKMSAGFLEVVKKSEPSPEKPAAKKAKESEGDSELSQMNAREAIAVVKETYDTGLLESWSGEEKRQTVVKAIEEQMAELDLGKDEEDEGE